MLVTWLQGLPSVTGYYGGVTDGLQGVTGGYRATGGYRSYRGLNGVTGGYKGYLKLQGITGGLQMVYRG